MSSIRERLVSFVGTEEQVLRLRVEAAVYIANLEARLDRRNELREMTRERLYIASTLKRFDIVGDAGLEVADRMLKEAAADMRMDVEAFLKSKKRVVSNARQEAMWRIYRETSLSTISVGKLFGKDHTTVVYALRRVSSIKGEKPNGCVPNPEEHPETENHSHGADA